MPVVQERTVFKKKFSKPFKYPLPEIERAVKSVEHGSAPYWDANSQALFFVDVLKKKIHKYVPSTGHHTRTKIEGNNNVSLIIPLEHHDHSYVVSIGRLFSRIVWDGESEKIWKIRTFAEVEKETNNTFSTGKCDPAGRLWAGTMGDKPEMGNLYTLEEGNEIKTQMVKTGIPNGLAWNEELKKFYYIDSDKSVIEQYDYDQNTGTITNCKVVFDLNKYRTFGTLGGMTIDTEGFLWVALTGGFKILKIDPRKEDCLVDYIRLPARQVTAVAFGGKNLDELYATTARGEYNNEKLEPPDNGATYKITGTGSKGFPGVRIRTLHCRKCVDKEAEIVNGSANKSGDAPSKECTCQCQ